MDHDFRAIQTIRRLTQAKRYQEAYDLLKETNHPQVPALETRLRHLIQQQQPPIHPQPLLTRQSVKAGTIMALFVAFILNSAAVYDFFFTTMCILLGFMIGVVAAGCFAQRKADYHSISGFIETKRRKPSGLWRW